MGFLVDDLDSACSFLESSGVQFKKKPADGNMRGLAFAYDPDGYWYAVLFFFSQIDSNRFYVCWFCALFCCMPRVEIIQRGGISMM